MASATRMSTHARTNTTDDTATPARRARRRADRRRAEPRNATPAGGLAPSPALGQRVKEDQSGRSLLACAAPSSTPDAETMSMLAACFRRSAAMQAPALRLGAARAALPALAVRSMSTVPTVTTSAGNVVPVDKYFDDESLVAHQARVRHADPANRTFNYTMVGGARFLGASAARLLVVKFLAAMNPAADVLALASLEVDISSLSAGNCMIVKWRGKPVFVRARTGPRRNAVERERLFSSVPRSIRAQPCWTVDEIV